jgi:hypothetical protein
VQRRKRSLAWPAWARHLAEARIDEANVWLEKARSPVPAALLTRSRLAASYAHGRETNLPPPNLPKPED